MPLPTLPLAGTIFRNTTIESKLRPKIEEFNLLVLDYNSKTPQEQEIFFPQVQEKFTKLLQNYTCSLSNWSGESELFGTINDAMQQEEMKFLPPFTVTPPMNADTFGKALQRTSASSIIDLIAHIAKPSTVSLNRLPLSIKEVLTHCHIKVLSAGNNIILRVKPNSPSEPDFVLSLSMKINEEILSQGFEERYPEYFVQNYYQTYVAYPANKQNFIIKVMPLLQEGNLDSKLSCATTAPEISQCTTYFQQMTVFFQKLEEQGILFPDAKVSNFMISDSQELKILDTKSYLPFHATFSADEYDTDYHFCYTRNYTPPEFNSTQTLNLNAMYVYFVGLNLLNLYFPKNINHPNALNVFNLLKDCLKTNPGDRITLEELKTRLQTLENTPAPLNRFQQEIISRQGILKEKITFGVIKKEFIDPAEVEKYSDAYVQEIQRKAQELAGLTSMSLAMNTCSDLENIEQLYQDKFNRQTSFFKGLPRELQDLYPNFSKEPLPIRDEQILNLKNVQKFQKELSQINIIMKLDDTHDIQLIHEEYKKKHDEFTEKFTNIYERFHGHEVPEDELRYFNSLTLRNQNKEIEKLTESITESLEKILPDNTFNSDNMVESISEAQEKLAPILQQMNLASPSLAKNVQILDRNMEVLARFFIKPSENSEFLSKDYQEQFEIIEQKLNELLGHEDSSEQLFHEKFDRWLNKFSSNIGLHITLRTVDDLNEYLNDCFEKMKEPGNNPREFSALTLVEKAEFIKKQVAELNQIVGNVSDSPATHLDMQIIETKLREYYQKLGGEEHIAEFQKASLKEQSLFIEKEIDALFRLCNQTVDKNASFSQKIAILEQLVPENPSLPLNQRVKEKLTQELAGIEQSYNTQMQMSAKIFRKMIAFNARRIAPGQTSRELVFNSIFQPAEGSKKFKYFLKLPVEQQNLILASLKRLIELGVRVPNMNIESIKDRFLAYFNKEHTHELSPEDIGYLRTINTNVDSMIEILKTQPATIETVERVAVLKPRI